jgi:hypothetical protein
MSYHVTILRTEGEREIPILRDEVERLVAAHPEFRVTVRDADQIVFSATGPSFDDHFLVYSGGNIWARNPDDPTLTRMIELAAALGGGARVRGDGLETYRSAGDPYVHPDDAPEVEWAALERSSRVRRRKAMAGLKWVFMAFVLATIVMRCCGR